MSFGDTPRGFDGRFADMDEAADRMSRWHGNKAEGAAAQQREEITTTDAGSSVKDERPRPRGFDGRFADMDEAADRMSSPWPPITQLEKEIRKAVRRPATPQP